MNPRQRRGVVLLIFTAIGALVTFGLVTGYVRSVSSQVGPMTTVLQLTRDVASLTELSSDDVEVVEVPARWAPSGALHSVDETAGLVTAGSYYEGAVIQKGMLEPPPGLQPGYREVAIIVDAETGVAGKVASGDYVDIIATVEDPVTHQQTAEVVVANAAIIDVGIPTTVEDQDASGNFSQGEGVPVTFALSASDSLKVAYAESFAVKLRLALRGDGDDGTLTPDQEQYSATATGAEGGQ